MSRPPKLWRMGISTYRWHRASSAAPTRLALISLLVSVLFTALAEPPPNAAPPPPLGSVWKVTSASGGRMYLCGTIHVLRAEDYPLAPAYESAYRDSTKLLFELPPGSSGGSLLLNRIQELGMLPRDQKLQDVIAKTTWQKMEAWAVSRKIPAGRLDGYRPWFAAITIAAMEYSVLGAQPDKGVDTFFEERAQKDGKPGEGLETVDFQLSLFANLTAAQQEDLLRQTLAEVTSLPDEYKEMIRAWKTGDLEALRRMLYREAEQYPELMDLFLHDRNKTWVGKLEALLSKGERVMVLIGAGHLAGPQGLIELLKARGHTVERCLEASGLPAK